jgi:hypothetical protein
LILGKKPECVITKNAKLERAFIFAMWMRSREDSSAMAITCAGLCRSFHSSDHCFLYHAFKFTAHLFPHTPSWIPFFDTRRSAGGFLSSFFLHRHVVVIDRFWKSTTIARRRANFGETQPVCVIKGRKTDDEGGFCFLLTSAQAL